MSYSYANKFWKGVGWGGGRQCVERPCVVCIQDNVRRLGRRRSFLVERGKQTAFLFCSFQPAFPIAAGVES